MTNIKHRLLEAADQALGWRKLCYDTCSQISSLEHQLDVSADHIAAQDKRIAELEAMHSQPFLFAIMGPDGKAHMDENCVSDDEGVVQYEVECMNEAQEGGYSVVPVYLAAMKAAK